MIKYWSLTLLCDQFYDVEVNINLSLLTLVTNRPFHHNWALSCIHPEHLWVVIKPFPVKWHRKTIKCIYDITIFPQNHNFSTHKCPGWMYDRSYHERVYNNKFCELMLFLLLYLFNFLYFRTFSKRVIKNSNHWISWYFS